jgi:hypothetical protein
MAVRAAVVAPRGPPLRGAVRAGLRRTARHRFIAQRDRSAVGTRREVR